jgi:hypothetical protein
MLLSPFISADAALVTLYAQLINTKVVSNEIALFVILISPEVLHGSGIQFGHT